jgi:hypothetical protein
MNQSEVVQILNKVQAEFDIKSLKYKNKNVWPILRYYMAYTLLKPKSTNSESDVSSIEQKNSKKSFLSNSIILKIYKILTILRWPVLFVQLKMQKIVFSKSVEKCLFVSPNFELYPDEVDGKKYSRYLDPYYELFQKKQSIAKLQLLENKQNSENNHIPIFSINQDVFFSKNKIEKYFHKKDISEHYNFEKRIKQLNDFAKKNNIEYDFNNWLINHLDEVNDFEIFFTYFLCKSNVKCVFFECYYSPCLFGLIAACKKLSIKTVDIQHGVVDVNYLGWKNIAKETELYLPHYYWVWSNSDLKSIKNEVNTEILIPVLGGNMWLAKFINSKQKNTNQSNNHFYKKRILVTLQFGEGFMDYMSNLVLELIKLTNQDYFWMFKFHPFSAEEEKTKFKKGFSEFSNTDFDLVNKMPLYEVFSNVQSHLVISSAVALEGIQFNLPTIIVHDLGADLFKNLIDENILCFSKSPLDIMNKIENFVPEQLSSDYKIQTSEEEAINQFELLMAS